MNPKSPLESAIKNRVLKCYEAANPSNLAEIDGLLSKYKGKEYILFNKLRAKYEKFPECVDI